MHNRFAEHEKLCDSEKPAAQSEYFPDITKG